MRYYGSNWRMKLAFFIAGDGIEKYRSKHARIVGQMSASYTEVRVIRVLEKWRDDNCFCDELARKKKNGVCSYHGTLAQIIPLIEEELK